jgi:hypothetical protein
MNLVMLPLRVASMLVMTTRSSDVPSARIRGKTCIQQHTKALEYSQEQNSSLFLQPRGENLERSSMKDMCLLSAISSATQV